MNLFLVLLIALPSLASQAGTNPSQPTYKDFERKPVSSMTEEEFAKIRQRIASQCGLHPESDLSRAPWYFHYELGLELARKGDPQRALDALIDATEHRSRPERGTRMYGVWFTNYLPYLQIARLHVQLGNWACAEDALRLSQELKEVSQRDPEFRELEELKQEAEAARSRERQNL
jgi:hypothetical protein